MEVLNNTVADKFCGLLQYLCKYKTAFEMVADEVEDENLKTALNGLSIESTQYAEEITNHLRLYGVPHRVETDLMFDCLEDDQPYSADCIPGQGNELMSICVKSESSITRAYDDILNEYLPLNNLRNVMLYQLNTLKIAFMKVKLLNEARFMTT